MGTFLPQMMPWSCSKLRVMGTGLVFVIYMHVHVHIHVLSRVSYRNFWWRGRSLWGTATVSCMPITCEQRLYSFFEFSGGGGGGGGREGEGDNSRAPSLCMKP